METLEQYQARLSKNRQSFQESPRLLEEVEWCNQLRRYNMFNVVAPEEAKAIEQSARIRGAVADFFTNLDAFYAEWVKDNEDSTFLIKLTGEAGSDEPFAGKLADSVYSSVGQHISKKERKQDWRLIRKTDDNDVKQVYLAHL